MSALLRTSIAPADHAAPRAVLALIEGSRGRDEDGLSPLHAIGTTQRLVKNAALFEEGDPSRHVY